MPTVSPQFSDNGEYLGSSIDNGRPSFHNGVVPQGFHVDPSTGDAQVFEMPDEDTSGFNVSEYERLFHAVDPVPILNLLVSDSQPNSPADKVGLLLVQSAAVSRLNCILVGIRPLCLRQ